MGCTAGVDRGGFDDGKVEIVLPVIDMPLNGGNVQAETPDKVLLTFIVPAGYPPGTLVKTRYIPARKPTEKPKSAMGSQRQGGEVSPSMKKGAASTSAAPSLAAVSANPKNVNASASLVGNGVLGGSEFAPPPLQAVEAQILHPLECGLPLLPRQLPKMDGHWEWIRNGNDDVQRLTRLDAGILLREAFARGGYCVKQGKDLKYISRFKCIQKMTKGTKILSFRHGLPKLAKDPKHSMTIEYGEGITVIEKAKSLVDEGFKPAAISAASAYHAGGGFTSGGRHALEEAFCSQSTLYASLERAKQLWDQGSVTGLYRSDSHEYRQHIPTDGCIVSPFVEVFRGNTDQGYVAYEIPVPLQAVISVAMYNRNSKVRDAPLDSPSDNATYEAGIRKKFTSMIHGAASSGADAVIIPDVGCGVFMNDPAVCGRIVGEVLYNYMSRFKRTVFTGKQEFYSAAMAALQKVCESGAMPITADQLKRGSPLPIDAHIHAKIGCCVACKRGLANADFHNLAVLMDKAHKSHQMEFLHESCVDLAHDMFPKRTTMMLPDVTRNAKSFLMALDLNGNGSIDKQELMCICALFWDGNLNEDLLRFEKDFEDRFQAWDLNKNGTVDMEEITAGSALLLGAQGAPRARPGDTINRANMSCIEWIQEQARQARDGPSQRGT